MRLVLGMMKHETNTFSPLRTDWARFQDWGAFAGEEARKAFEKTAMPLGAYMKLARARGADFIIPMAAEA
ncbi:MAG: M81 family metallopeptidase, partial [Oceanibaculum sp.]